MNLLAVHSYPPLSVIGATKDALVLKPYSRQLDLSAKDSNWRDLSVALERRLNIRSWKDWYRVTKKDIYAAGGGSVLQSAFNNSTKKLLTTLYPQHPWDLLKLGKAAPRRWTDQKKRKAFMSLLEKNLDISDWRDWYKLTQKDVRDAGGYHLLKEYDHSPTKLVMATFPDHPWKPFHFKNISKTYWRVRENQEAFMHHLEKELSIVDWKDWYQLSLKDICDHGGVSLVKNYFNGSPSKLVMALYPQHPWNVSDFKRTPNRYWRKEANRRAFMDRLEKELNISDWTDWYRVTSKEIAESGGRSLLRLYNGSPAAIVISALPQHPWNQFEFRSKLEWSPLLIHKFLERIASSLQLEGAIAWRTLSTVQLRDFRGGDSLLKRTGSLYGALKIAYPSSDWDFIKGSRISKPQYHLLEILWKYIPRDKIIVNHRHDALIHRSGVKAELDIWIPSLNLAIEYHGEHHYHQLWERSQHPSIRTIRDDEKRSLCSKIGIDLVEVPYWWDKSEEQLVAIIRGVRSQFLRTISRLDEIAPIRRNSLTRSSSIEVKWTLGFEYSSIRSKSHDWYASEKMDGIRCSWDGFRLYSRGGHLIDAVEPMPVDLLDCRADGELWYGRDVRTGGRTNEYPIYVVFDALLSPRE